MAHIHDLIDFVVSIYIVYNNKVLLINHRELHKWLPIGGHIELSEDPEQALMREIKEECGLEEIELIGEEPPRFNTNEYKFFHAPYYLNIHRINERHKHIAFQYFGKSNTDKIKLNKNEHLDIRWFTLKDLDDKKYNIFGDTRFMAKKALETIKS